MASVKIEFQYKSPESTRPIDMVQNEELSFTVPEGAPLPALFIPNVGDTVSLESFDGDGQRGAYKVITRHFSYTQIESEVHAYVNIVVTDVDGEEMAARQKL